MVSRRTAMMGTLALAGIVWGVPGWLFKRDGARITAQANELLIASREGRLDRLQIGIVKPKALERLREFGAVEAFAIEGFAGYPIAGPMSVRGTITRAGRTFEFEMQGIPGKPFSHYGERVSARKRGAR